MGVQSIRTGGTYVKIDKNENGTGDGYLWKRVRKTPGWHRSWANFSLYRCVPTGVHGPTCIFWASLMPLSLPDARAALAPAAGATARRRGAAPVGRLPPLPRLGAIRGRHHGPHGPFGRRFVYFIRRITSELHEAASEWLCGKTPSVVNAVLLDRRSHTVEQNQNTKYKCGYPADGRTESTKTKSQCGYK
jgi:hypothetical protein